MKKTALLFFAILTGLFSKAQEVQNKAKSELDVSFYSTDIGNNISAEYNKNIKKHTFIVGIKCHLNKYIKLTGPRGDAYHKQFHAENFNQFIGASIGYEYHLRDINPYLSPYLLFNSQYAHMITKHRIMISDTPPMKEIQTFTDGAFTALENTIGAGLSIKLTERLSLNQSAGIGAAFFLKDGSKQWIWEPMYQWRAGISVKLN